ncbi:MAG: dihydroorotate dehydrogenase electron transfer subunit [Armatimonadota bacterium]
MKGLYDCEVIQQREAAPGVFSTLLKGPAIAAEAQPGQFVNVQVSKTTDPLLRRPFSVHAAYPEEGVFSLLYALRGRGTALLARTQPADTLSVVGPLGRPFDLGESPDARHIIVAGGCGAAPLHFLCDALCRKWGCERVTVLSGAQSKDAVICEAEFRAHGVDVGISTDDGSYGFHGLVTQLLEDHLSRLGLPTSRGGQRVRVYSCGPDAMLKEVARICRWAGVESCQVSLENFMACGIGVCMGCVQKVRHQPTPFKRVCTDGPVFEAEEVIWE